MHRFLVFFQKYIHQKSYILMDLEFMILDCFESFGFFGLETEEDYAHIEGSLKYESNSLRNMRIGYL